MSSVTIFGTGNMANAIGGVFAAGGSSVAYIGRERVGAARIEGDVVILAVPHPAVGEIVSTYADQLAGKTVVDITNPVDFSTFDSLVVPAGSSLTAQIQEKLPQSSVVKAFNTNFAATLASGKVGELPTTVLIAGDDAAAKSALISAIEAGGLDAIDAGSLSRASELEAIGFLQLTLAVGEQIAWTGGFASVR